VTRLQNYRYSVAERREDPEFLEELQQLAQKGRDDLSYPNEKAGRNCEKKTKAKVVINIGMEEYEKKVAGRIYFRHT